MPRRTSTPPVLLLVVSNESDIAHLFRLFFEEKGFQVRIASTLVEAVQLITHKRPGGIIVKCFPENGLLDTAEVCRFLRSSSDGNTIPILAISPKRDTAISAGATFWFDLVFDIRIYARR